MVPSDVNVFPLDTPNVLLTDTKQYRAAKRSLEMLTDEMRSTEYGTGYQQLLSKRATEAAAIITKLEEKYGIN